MTWAKGDAIQTELASAQARRLLTAFDEVRLADAPEPESDRGGACRADVVFHRLLAGGSLRGAAGGVFPDALSARIAADKLKRRAEAEARAEADAGRGRGMTAAPRLQPLRMQLGPGRSRCLKDARDEAVIAAVRRTPPALAGPRAARRGRAATADRHSTRNLALDREREKTDEKASASVRRRRHYKARRHGQNAMGRP